MLLSRGRLELQQANLLVAPAVLAAENDIGGLRLVNPGLGLYIVLLELSRVHVVRVSPARA